MFTYNIQTFYITKIDTLDAKGTHTYTNILFHNIQIFTLYAKGTQIHTSTQTHPHTHTVTQIVLHYKKYSCYMQNVHTHTHVGAYIQLYIGHPCRGFKPGSQACQQSGLTTKQNPYPN
jgi:hypothetical protein